MSVAWKAMVLRCLKISQRRYVVHVGAEKDSNILILCANFLCDDFKTKNVPFGDDGRIWGPAHLSIQKWNE